MDAGSIWTEVVKALPSLGVALYPSAGWDGREKRRKLGVIYDICDEFFAIWKLWETVPSDLRDTIEWISSESPPYLAFKALAADGHTGHRLNRHPQDHRQPARDQTARRNLRPLSHHPG